MKREEGIRRSQYNLKMILWLLIILILCQGYNVCFASKLNHNKISAQNRNFLPDSTKSASAIASIDSIKAPRTSSVGLDTILKYEASIVDTRVNEKKIYLMGQADVKYKTIHLTAEKITLDWETHLITAEGVPDTIYKKSDNSPDSAMTVMWKGLPTLSDAGDVMNGFKMVYNYRTEKGTVVQGRTEFEGGYYLGNRMKRISDEIINISNGSFTSCDREDHPHYHFESRRIKVIINDKVIARPVVLYFGHIPVAAIPFAVFPNKKGRHSGVIIPTYGESGSEGRFIRGLGYYWAPSDYFDTSVKVDYFDRAGWVLRGDLDYNKRYILNGNISGSYTRKNFISGQKEQRWDLLINHNHTIDPTMSFGIRGQFISDKNFYKDFSSNFDTRLNRRIRSDATFSKNWSEQRLSLSANISQERDVETGQISQILPQMRFSMSQRALFGKTDRGSRSNASSALKRTRNEIAWYQAIYFSYNSSLINSTTRGGEYPDGRKYPEQTTRYMNHNLSLSMNTPQKIFGWLTLGQSLNYEERWYDRYKTNRFHPETNWVEQDTVQGFASRRVFSYGLSSSTKIYGMFTPNIGKIQSLRHVVSPSISFNYQPDFTDPRWGYVDVFFDTTGKKITVSKLIDVAPGGGQKNIAFSLGNLFQMKTVDGEKENKFDLFSLDFSSSYNFKAETFKLSNLSSSFRASPTRNFNVNISASHSFYEYDSEKQRTVNKLLLMNKEAWKEKKFLRLVNFRIGMSLNLQGRKKSAAQEKKPGPGSVVVVDEVTGQPMSEQEYYDRLYEPGGNRFEVNDRFSGLDIPWRMSLSFSFSLSKYNPARPDKNYYLDIGNMEVQLTKNWKVNYSAHFDLEKNQVVNHSITIYRDLHCWEARLTWRPSGIGGNSYYLRINVKAPQLRDLKYEQRGGRSSVLRY